MKKNIMAVGVGALIIAGAFYMTAGEGNGRAGIVFPEIKLSEENNITESNDFMNEEMTELVSCLEEKGVVIYGSAWCPACSDVVERFGGYDMIAPIYVECTEEEERCREEMHGTAVPEVQIEGEICRSNRYPQELAEKVGCEM